MTPQKGSRFSQVEDHVEMVAARDLEGLARGTDRTQRSGELLTLHLERLCLDFTPADNSRWEARQRVQGRAQGPSRCGVQTQRYVD